MCEKLAVPVGDRGNPYAIYYCAKHETIYRNEGGKLVRRWKVAGKPYPPL